MKRKKLRTTQDKHFFYVHASRDFHIAWRIGNSDIFDLFADFCDDCRQIYEKRISGFGQEFLDRQKLGADPPQYIELGQQMREKFDNFFGNGAANAFFGSKNPLEQSGGCALYVSALEKVGAAAMTFHKMR